MSKRLVFALVLMVLGAVGLSGCDACDMVAPDLVSPELWDILSGPLEWSYSDTSCVPDHFEVELAREGDFSVIYDIEIVPGTTTTLTPSGLDPGEYYWRVRAEDEGTYGPYPSMLRSFFVGPVCDPTDLVPPELVNPPYGGIYDYDYDLIDWHWPQPACIPESYRVEVSQYPDFHDAPRNEHLGNPSTAWSFGERPPDATQYFWRITPHVDGSLGPPSEVGMFYTGPICTGADLMAPHLVSPDSTGPTPVDPLFRWAYPDSSCIPEGFHLEVFEDWEMTIPYFEVHEPELLEYTYTSDTTFPDCQRFYWRVGMITDGGTVREYSDLEHFTVDSGSCDCTADTIPVPIPVEPDRGEIFPDTHVRVSWRSPGGCFQDGELLSLSADPDFEDTTFDALGRGVFHLGTDPPGLEPATQYWWKVAYYIDDAGGEPIFGDFNDRRSFFTGPECGSAAELGEPILIEPADGAVVDTTLPVMHYLSGASCLPDEYMVNLHMVPDLSDPNLMGRVPIPATYVLSDSHLENCEEYFWMVTAVQDGVDGPHSTINSFFVNEGGLCPSPGAGGTAKSNNFCRKGTFAEHFEALWTINEGDGVMAVARNPLGTYLKLIILDQDTKEALNPEISCWSYIGNFEPNLAGAFDQLPDEEPPAPPAADEKPAQLVCEPNLDKDDCQAAGGTYFDQNQYCGCP